ncbi:nucleotidyltransferase domain-containing protein [Aquimarina muelleri]|uniref:DNA polymerase n=1 Tax=Aquimarina muelleri TaxID=279356 RepID=A0A918JS79_9FLAO|nr:nucleotidyltransferase domain-containing protein [Aquimarina muelleri]MCX2763079.1 nucleotidyltransferase domain-containing protein [Aquimarina muelleri]GGX02938.1 DNA polymerase [Aquimarina muelleri]
MKYGLSKISIEKILEVFKANSEIEEAIIFGSRAKGNYREGSDVDITLKGDKLTFDKLLRIESQIEDKFLPYKFDLSIFENIDNKELIDHINRIGKVFYNRKSL